MTTLLYHADSYQNKFIAEVTSRNEEIHGVILSQTAFFPGGGGQPGDKGAISYKTHKSPVKKVKNIDGQLIHFLSQLVPLPEIGSSLSGEIDWNYRYQLMRTHTAMHILCGVIFRDYGASVTGGNMTPLKGRMDFEFSSLEKDLVSRIEKTVIRKSKMPARLPGETFPARKPSKSLILFVPKSIFFRSTLTKSE
jgi:misacylated tRNA(Ala) deacylase